MSDDTVQDAPPVPVPPPAEAAEKPDVDDDADDDSVTERYRVPQDLYDSLLSVGFSSNAIKKSIIAGCIDEKTCMQWLEMHLDHPELNTAIEPHIRVTVVKKRVLTDEERAAKIAELKQKIQQNKVLEAQSLKAKSAEDEKRRVEEGKAAMIAKANREAAQRKLDYEQRRREKEQDRITKERLQFELAVDRFVRLGHSREEATVKAKQEFEEKAAKVAEERARREEADRAEREARERSEAARQSSRAAGGGGGGGGGWDLSKFVQGAEPDSVNDAPSSSGAQVVVDFDRDEITSANPTVDDFTAILSRSASLLGASNEPRAVTGRQILHRVLKAIALAPLDRKVRTLKVTSAVFTQKLIPMPLACYFLRQAGFQEASSTPELAAAGVSDLFTMHAFVSRRVENALTALQQAGV